jgi:hypothetical protein
MHHTDYDAFVMLCETPAHPALSYEAGRRVEPRNRWGLIAVVLAVAIVGAIFYPGAPLWN